ncbi:MAG: hypothetical protein M1822_006603 [Bathelium mastoideum]|nr:MAG: hypothetical protein M1822_006603 [Bathelium mastoideum]
MSSLPPQSTPPLYAHFAGENLTIGAGVAIFHIASQKVVVCYHPSEGLWFLPKGRRDANEDSAVGAVREGYEESGYLNRLLPLPLPHRQPSIRDKADPRYTPFFIEPVWTELFQMNPTRQYILFWYVAETVPPEVEEVVTKQQQALQNEEPTKTNDGTPESANARRSITSPAPYVAPALFPKKITLKERIAMEPEGYQPVKHVDTGVDSDELTYESYLMPIEEAMRKLRGTISSDVVRRAWEGIQLRIKMEE